MRPKPRKIFVMITDELRPLAELSLRRLATITAIIPPQIGGYAYRYELENPDWPRGDFNQANLIFTETVEGTSFAVKAELVMV